MFNWNSLQVSTKLTISFGLLISFSVGLYAFYATMNYRDDKIQYTHLVNNHLTTSVTHRIQYHFKQIEDDIQDVLSALKTRDLGVHQRNVIMSQFQRNPYFVALSLYRLGRKNKLLYSLLNKEQIELNTNLRQNIRKLDEVSINSLPIKNKKQFIPNQDISNEIITLTYPVDKRGKVQAVIHIAKTFMYEFIPNTNLNDYFVIDNLGMIIAHKEKKQIGKSAKDHPVVQIALSNPFPEGGLNYSLPETGMKYFGNFSKINDNLSLVIQVNETEALASIMKMVNKTIFLAIGLIGWSLICGFFFSRGLVNPLRRLAAVTEDLAAGRYQVDIKVQGNDEISQLARRFKHLGRRLYKREEELEKVTAMAIRDGLTGLYNHRYFQHLIEEHFAVGLKNKIEISLLMIDVDNFKKFNDTYGHLQGDEVLKELAKVLDHVLRGSDYPIRYGGEEFAVLLPGTNKKQAGVVAERIRSQFESLRIPLVKGQGTINCTMSIGVASLNEKPFENASDFVSEADRRLYQAKDNGRNQVAA